MRKFFTILLLTAHVALFAQQDSVFVFKLKWNYKQLIQNEKITNANLHQLLA